MARVAALALLLVLSACSGDGDDNDDGDGSPGPTGPSTEQVVGSLVRTTTRSEVAVVLDEIPRSMRARVTEELLAEPDEFWTERAKRQLVMTTYRLVFRDAFYKGRKSLPLPPQELWAITLAGEPSRYQVDGHDVVGVPYEFDSVLLSSEASPGEAEPKLRKVGGVRIERFVLPVDPELLMQRTGYACMDESQYPFNSVDSEEADYFYDDSAVVEKSLSPVNYHHTRQPEQSCVDAVHDEVGAVDVELRYERLSWDPELADQYRYGEVTGALPDLAVYAPDFEPSRTVYRYVHARGSASCEVQEGSVTGTGWRRLLEFATADENVGEQALEIGEVDYFADGKAGDLDRHRLFELSACHDHYHFRYYGQLGLVGADDLNAKQGFCLQSTNRVANRETSPLHQPYSDCGFQGVSSGWVDQYQAGLPNQWLDTTKLDPGTYARTFTSNPEGVLCEGALVDETGERLEPGEEFVWGETDLVTEDGEPVEAPLCSLSADWDANNDDAIDQVIEPHGLGLITSECTRGQIGPLRNCGFGAEPETAPCQPGEKATAMLSIPESATPQVVRLTEYSHQLKSPIPARYEDSWVPLKPGVSDQPAMLANLVLMPGRQVMVIFDCPAPRDGGAPEPGGRYSIYSAPVWPGDELAPIKQKALAR